MSILGKNADLYRRLRLYGLGFVLGLIAVSFIHKGKSCQMPSSLKLDELKSQPLQYTKHGLCRMKCRNITEQEVAELFRIGKINYDKSDVHDKPYPTYAIEGITSDKQGVRMIIADVDSISRVVTVIDLNLKYDTCECK